MRIVLLTFALVCTAGFHLTVAQHPSAFAQTKKTEQAPQARAVSSVPNDQQVATLIISTLVALNQANFTGNYSVFREMASPNFQASNSSARLAEIFADLRKRRFDLSPIIFLQPKLLQKPAIDKQGMLRVTGFFATAPEQLNFDLLYRPVRGRWLLFGIAANTTPASLSQSPSGGAGPKPAN